MRITEVKRHLDGTDDRFDCVLLLRAPHVAVVRFDHWRGRSAGGFFIPRGSRTHGFFWRRRPYSLYRIAGPDGIPIADRYDVVADVHLGDREVSYLDLLVDVWVAPDGAFLVEDEDEVADARARGLLSETQVREIGRTTALLRRRHRAVIRDAEALLARVPG